MKRFIAAAFLFALSTPAFAQTYESYQPSALSSGVVPTTTTQTGSNQGSQSASEITDGSSGGVQIGSPTGGAKGNGTLNSAGTIYQNNVPVSTTTGITATDGTHTVNNATSVTFSGATVSGTAPNATVTVSGGSPTVDGVTIVNNSGTLYGPGSLAPYGGYKTGQYYMTPGIPLSTTASTVTSGIAVAMPWTAGASGTIQHLGVCPGAATTSASNTQVAIAADNNGSPGAILATSSSTPWASGISTCQSWTITLAITGGERLWLEFESDTTNGGKLYAPSSNASVQSGNVIMQGYLGAPTVLGVFTNSSGSGFSATATFGTFPTTGWSQSTSNSNSPPMIAVGF